MLCLKMSTIRVEEVTAVKPVELGEGPHWVDSEQALYFVDLLAGGLHRFDPATNKHTSTKPAGQRSLSLTVPVSSRRGLHVVAHGRDLSVVEWDGFSANCQVRRVLGTVEEGLQSQSGTRFNDGKADPSGRLWAGTMSTEIDIGKPQPRVGSLYSLEQGGNKIQNRVDNIEISNGLAWTSDTFYYIDSNDKRVDAFDFDASTGDITNRRCVFDYVKNGLSGIPDGMTIDTSGNLWVATFDGSQVLCVDPKAGKLVTTISIPAHQVTSAAWGGRGLDELYVTTAAIKAQAGKPKAGALFRVTGLGARGAPATEVILDQKIINQLA
ncbi:hypothetical protein B566_EDAN007596 [Ephemera danica]|nr:hypothetical protein B566_EDAN007596 [Ephemera danica]